ncbi:MAG: homoserine kinase, partial [Rhizobiaceae bacterium]
MAVYTDIPDEELTSHLELYNIGELHAIKGIAEGVENSNFLITTDTGTYILTLYEKRVDVADLPFFLGLMKHLSSRGITCPEPVEMRSGQSLGTLAGRPAAIVSFLDGISLRRPTAANCRQAGEIMARMHIAARDFDIRRENALGMVDWRPLFKKSRDGADTVSSGLADLVNSELEFLENNWSGDLPSGVIHADMFPDNVLFLKNQLSGVIDFYFACNDL